MVAEPHMRFVRVPANVGLGGYWLKDAERSTPSPQPIDVMLGSSWMVRKVHDTIPGILVSLNPNCSTLNPESQHLHGLEGS
jgi:hypothetical protein